MSELLKNTLCGQTLEKAIENGIDINSTEVKRVILHNWSNTGLIEGLHGVEKELVARKLEETAHYLIKCKGNYDERIGTFIFPIIRRMINGLSEFEYDSRYVPHTDKVDGEWLYQTVDRNNMLKELIDPSMVLNRLEESYDATIEMLKGLHGHQELDYEVEACALISKKLVESHVRMHSKYRLKRTKDGVIKLELGE